MSSIFLGRAVKHLSLVKANAVMSSWAVSETEKRVVKKWKEGGNDDAVLLITIN